MSEEIWKPVPSKPKIMASSLGRILLPEREALMPNGGIRKYFTKPTYGNTVKASKTARHTYKGMYNKFFGNLKIHRLVCEAFHGPPPEDKPYVIHIDEDAHNNRSENLRWGSQEENLNMPKFIAYCKSRVGDESPIRKYLAKHGGL